MTQSQIDNLLKKYDKVKITMHNSKIKHIDCVKEFEKCTLISEILKFVDFGNVEYLENRIIATKRIML